MEIIAIPPTMPPTIGPIELLPFEGGVRDGDPVEDAAAEDVPVYTPDAPKIAPGPYSGLSIWNVGESP